MVFFINNQMELSNYANLVLPITISMHIVDRAYYETSDHYLADTASDITITLNLTCYRKNKSNDYTDNYNYYRNLFIGLYKTQLGRAYSLVPANYVKHNVQKISRDVAYQVIMEILNFY